MIDEYTRTVMNVNNIRVRTYCIGWILDSLLYVDGITGTNAKHITSTTVR